MSTQVNSSSLLTPVLNISKTLCTAIQQTENQNWPKITEILFLTQINLVSTNPTGLSMGCSRTEEIYEAQATEFVTLKIPENISQQYRNKKNKETRDEQAVFQSQQTINTRTNAYCNTRPRKCLESSNVGRSGVIQTSKQACTPWVNHIMYILRKVIVIKRFSMTLKRAHAHTQAVTR